MTRITSIYKKVNRKTNPAALPPPSLERDGYPEGLATAVFIWLKKPFFSSFCLFYIYIPPAYHSFSCDTASISGLKGTFTFTPRSWWYRLRPGRRGLCGRPHSVTDDPHSFRIRGTVPGLLPGNPGLPHYC